MDNLLNSDLNTPEINYSDIGKEVKTSNALLNLPSDDVQPVRAPYQTPLSIDLKDYTRFISSDAFPKVGIDPSLTQQEMESQYDANQSNWEAFSNMMGKLSNKTADSFVNFFQADFLTNDALINEVSKQLEEEKQYDLYHPNFDSRSDETRDSFLQWIPGFKGSADNYEQFLPNLGYTIGMAGAAAVQNIVFGAMTGGLGELVNAASTAKKGKALWDLISGFKNIEVGYNALRTLNQGNKIVKATELGLAGFNMVAAFRSEAASEAAQTGQSTFQKLKDDYVSVHGYDPFGEDLQRIKDNAYSAAKTDFWMNAPILMTSNLIQFSRLLMPSAGKVVSEVMKDATKGYTLTGEIGKATFEAEQSFAKAFSAASKMDKVKLGASAAGSVLKAMKDPLAEGMEEALQRFSSSFSQDYYTDKYYGKNSIGKSVQEATSDMLSAEGMQEFIGGALIGFGTSVVGKISNKTGLSDKYANITGGETRAQAEERKANYRTDLLDLVNKSGVDFAMKDNGFADAIRSIVTSKEMIDAKNMDETFDAINLKNHGGYKMIINAVKSGQLDWIKEQYKKIGETGDINKLAEIFNVNPDDINKNNIAELTNSIIRKIDQTASNYKKVTAEFEKVGLEKELIDNHNRLMVDALGNELELKKKYNIPVSEKMGAHWDKLDTTEKVNYNSYLQQIEQSQIDHYAYKEALDRAAVVYQTMVDDKDRSNSIVNTLNQNKPGLNYSESLSLLDKNTISKLKKQVQTSLGLATEKRDISKFEKQLELLDKAKETIDAGMDPVALGNIMKEYARVSNLGNASSADIDMFEKSTDLNKSLEDLAKLQKKNNQNLDIFNFLYNGKNFDAYRRTISEDLSSFFDQVAKWKEALDKDLESAKTETETETKVETKPGEKKETKKEKSPIGEEIPFEETKTGTEKPVSTKTHKNTTTFDDFFKNEAIEKFIKRHPIYKPEDIKFVVEKDKEGNKTVKVITNHVIVGGYKDLSNEEEFRDLIDQYNKDLKKEEERLADKEAIAKKVKDFVNEMQEVIKDLKEIRTKDRNSLLDEIAKFKKENRLGRETPDEIIKLRKQIESIPELVENTGASQVSNDFLEETATLPEYRPSARPYSPLKSIVQQAEVEVKDGYYQETGNLNKGFEEGSYLDFVQSSLDSMEFNDAMQNSVYELRVVHDSEDYDYERSEEFKKQMAEGTQKFGNIIVVTDSNGNPIRFDDNYNPVSTGGRIIVYKFSIDKFNVGDAIEVLQNITKGQFSYEQARQSVLTELGQLQAIDDFLDNNPEEKVAVDFFKVSKGVLLGSSKLSNTKEFFGDKQFDLKIVKGENAKGAQLVPFMNGHAYNGALVAVFDGEFVQVYTNRISDELATEINTLLNHDYVKEDGTVDEQIKQVKEYLDSLIYTKEGGRRFKISGSRIVFTDGKNVIEQLSTEQKLRPILNVFSKYLQQDSLKPKFKIVDNVMSLDTTKDGEIQFSSVSVKQYKKFLTENSYLRGKLLDGKIKLVNKYIQFNVPQESLDLIGLGNKEEIITPKEVIVSTTKTQPTPAPLNKLTELSNTLNDLYEKKEQLTYEIESYQDSPSLEQIIVENLPAISKESAERETGGQVGRGKDINPTLIAKKADEQISVEAAAESVLEQIAQYYGDRYDVQDVRSAIIDILRSGKTKNQYLKELDKTKDLRDIDKQIKEVQKQYDELLKNDFNGVNPFTVSNDITIDNNSKEKDPVKKTIADGINSAADLNNIFGDNNVGVNNDEEDPFRKKSYKGEIALDLMDKEEWDFLTKIVGKEKIINLFNIANSNAWGKWTTAGVTLWSNPKKGTGYHESWHHFSQLYLTKKEKIALYNEVRNKVPALSNASDFQVEEYLADDFMNFMLSGGKSELLSSTPVKKNIFQKIWDVLKALFGTPNVNIEQLYNDLRIGNLYNYTPSVDNVMWGKLERSIYKEGSEIIPMERVEKYVRAADVYIGDILTEKLTNLPENLKSLEGTTLLNQATYYEWMENPEKLNYLYNRLRKQMLDNYQSNIYLGQTKEDMEKIIFDNDVWSKFISEHQELSNIGISQDVDVETDEEISKDAVFSDKIYELPSNTIDLINLLPKKIEDMLRLIPEMNYNYATGKAVVALDDEGLPKLAITEDLRKRLIVELESILKVDKMIEKLSDPKILSKLPEAAKILEFIPSKEDVELEKSNDRKFEKISIRQSFLQAFTNPYIRSIMLYVDESGKVSVQELVTKGDVAIKKLFIDTFNNMADTSFGITEGIVKTDADGLNYISRDINDYEFDFTRKETVLKFLSLLGVDFDPSLFQNDKIYTEFKNKITNQDLERLYKALAIRSMYELSAYTRNPIDTLSKDIFHDVTDKDGVPVILESGKQKVLRLKSEYSIIKELIEFSNKYVRAIPSLMYINAKGQAEYAIQRHNGFTQRLSVINSVDSYKELIETPGFENYNMSNNYHMMGAKWMDLLFDFSTPEGKRRIDVKTGLPVRLDIVNYNAFQSAKTLNNFGEEINPVKASTADLTKSDRFFMDVYAFVTNGIVPTIRTSDAKSFYSIFPSTYNPDSEIMTNLAIPLSEFASMKNVFASDKFLSIAKEYLKAELYKIKNKKEIFRDSLLKFEESVAKFTLFDDILSKDTKDNLINDLEGKEKSTLKQIGKDLGTVKTENLSLDEIIDKNIENIKADINAYFSGEVEEFSIKFNQYGLSLKSFPAEISKDNELEKEITELKKQRNKEAAKYKTEEEGNRVYDEYEEKIKEVKNKAKLGESKTIEKLGQVFVANYFIQAVEFLKFFESDLGYYSAYFKRSKGNGSDGALGIYDDTIVNFLANTPSMASVLGVTMTENDYKENRTIVWENDKRPSVLNDPTNLTETLGDVATTKMVHDYVISKLLESGKDLSEISTEELNDLVSTATTTLKDYTETDGADGQAECTLDFYRFVLNLFGNWSKQQEDGYQAQVLKFGIHEKKYTDEQIELVQNKIKELEKKSKGVTYPPLKLNNRTVVNNSAYDPKFDKFSIAPMLFEAIIGTPLEKRNKEMLMNKINYGTFQSGTKLSHPNLFNFFTDEIEPKENYVISTNPQFLKEQIKTNPSIKEQVTISTQSRVLIFADSFENELPIDFKGNKEAWDKLSEKERIKISPIYRIYKTYLKNVNDRLDYNRQEFYNEIGVTGNDKYIEFTDQKKLIEVIQREIKERGLNKNVEEYIVYDPISKKNKLPLDYAPNRTGIGDIILGLVFKRIVKEKATGSQLIQVAGAGTSSTYRKGTEKDILIYGTNGLNFYYLAKDKNGVYRTVPMGVKVALNGTFKNLLNIAHPDDGEPIKTRERLNEIIAPDPNKKASFVKWIKDHREKLTITGVRIPVGDLNFHDIMEVKQFLPEEAGDIIILPHEVTTKSGTDFDFDKMTIYKPTINSKGELVKFYHSKERTLEARERIKEINDRINTVRKTQSQQVQSIVENFQSVEGLSKAKFATYKKVNELNKQINDLNKKATALESEIQESVDKIGFIDSANYTEYENLISKVDKLSDERNELLSSMEDMKIIGAEFLNASKELKDLKNEKQDIYLTLNKNNHLTNELIRIYRSVLTDPKKFYKLITPSKNPDFKEASNYIGDKVKRYNKDYNNTAVTSYFSSLDKGLQLLSTKGLLGIFAKLNKMGPLLQKAGFGLNLYYYAKSGKDKVRVDIKTPLMTLKQEELSRKDGYISFGLRNTLSNKNLQDMKSQGIVSTVDIGSDSTFARFGANSENIGVLTLLLNMGLDPKVIAEFLNQPVLIKMYDFIDKNYKSDSAMENTYDLLLSYLKNTEEGIDFKTDSRSLNQNMYRFSEGELESMLMDSNTPDAFLLSEDREFIKRQLEILAHYETLKKIGDAYLQFQLNFSWDTSKNDSVIMAEQNDQAINQIMESPYFRKEGLENLKDNSITSGFRNNFIVKELFTNLFPIASDKTFIELLTENFPKTSRKMAARKVLVNDFVEAIIKTFGTYKGENLYTYAESMMMGESSLVNRFKKLKQSHPELKKDFSLVKRLFPNIDTNKQDPKTHNFEVYRVMDNKTSDQNNYIDQFRKLMNYPDAEVRKFFKDLSILSFHQSGFNKSYLSFFDIVPIDELLPSFMIANNAFENLSDESKISFIYDFLEKAKFENPRYYRISENSKDKANNYSERRKRYKFDSDKYESGEEDNNFEFKKLSKKRKIEESSEKAITNQERINDLKLQIIESKSAKVLSSGDKVEVRFIDSDSESVLTVENIKKEGDNYVIKFRNSKDKVYTYTVDATGEGEKIQIIDEDYVLEKDKQKEKELIKEYESLTQLNQPFIQGRFSVPTISDKVSKYTIRLSIGEEERMGYKVTFKEHPEAIIYIGKTSNGKWVMDNLNTSMQIASKGETLREVFNQGINSLKQLENIDESNEKYVGIINKAGFDIEKLKPSTGIVKTIGTEIVENSLETPEMENQLQLYPATTYSDLTLKGMNKEIVLANFAKKYFEGSEEKALSYINTSLASGKASQKEIIKKLKNCYK